MGTAEERGFNPADEEEDGRLLAKLASDSRPEYTKCHGSPGVAAALVGVGGGGRRSEASESLARRRPAFLIVVRSFLFLVTRLSVAVTELSM